MTAPLIAPLIPPRARPGGREHGTPTTPRRLPVAAVPEVPVVPDDVLYGFGRMDSSGRVVDRAMTGALGWQPGDRLTLTAAAGVVVARRNLGGTATSAAPGGLCALIRSPGVKIAGVAGVVRAALTAVCQLGSNRRQPVRRAALRASWKAPRP